MNEPIICTLFEKHYHHGVAALTNSLYARGFRGSVYAGYRGEIPAWASGARDNSSLNWIGARTIEVEKSLQLHLLPLDTSYHLTNYKPDFMLRLLNEQDKNAGGIFYFDPDIIVNVSWNLFIEWLSCGVALCEDVNSPLAQNHPKRVAWRRFFGERGFTLRFREPMYVNGGFVGASRNNSSFLEKWKLIQEAMAGAIGGLQRSAFPGVTLSESEQGPFSPFGRTDQDALNATVEAWDGETSIVGQEGMAFKPGEPLLPHALGHMKPWQIKPISQMLSGVSPRLVDREYWKYAKGPLRIHSDGLIRRKIFSIGVAAFFSRFYKRG